MATEAMGELLSTIGQHVADVLGRTPDDVFVFIEAGDQWCGAAIFDNQKDTVQYHEFEPETDDIILELWDAAEPDKKWSVLLYDIKDGKFAAEFLYTDDLDHDPLEYNYRQDALKARYGDKPVIYPEMEDGEWDDLTEDDLSGDGAPQVPEPPEA